MRTLGSVLFLLFLAIFGFGFSLSHSFNLTKELATTRQQINALQAEKQDLQSHYQNLELENKRLATQLQEQRGENADQQAQLERLETERAALARQIEMYQNRLAALEKVHPLLTWLNNSSAGRFASLIVLPSLPLSLGAIYIFKSRKRTASQPQRSSISPVRHHKQLVVLTLEECHMLAQLRRSHMTHTLSMDTKHYDQSAS